MSNLIDIEKRNTLERQIRDYCHKYSHSIPISKIKIDEKYLYCSSNFMENLWQFEYVKINPKDIECMKGLFSIKRHFEIFVTDITEKGIFFYKTKDLDKKKCNDLFHYYNIGWWLRYSL